MKSFVRMAKINNVTGRRDYLAREGQHASKEQESVLLFCDDFQKWDDLQTFEEAQGRHTNQARELIIALPNTMAALSTDELNHQVRQVIKAAVGDRPTAYAVHWNDTKTNLHLHVMFSERSIDEGERQPMRYRQDIWAKEDGSRALKAVDRHHIMHHKGDIQRDKNGNIKYKLAEKCGFTEKDPSFKAKGWLQEAKEATVDALTRLGHSVTPYDATGPFLAEKHQGKGHTAYTERIARENAAIRAYNEGVAELLTVTHNPPDLHYYKRQAIKEFKQEIFQPSIERIQQFIEQFKEYLQEKFDKLFTSTSNIPPMNVINDPMDKISPDRHKNILLDRKDPLELLKPKRPIMPSDGLDKLKPKKRDRDLDMDM